MQREKLFALLLIALSSLVPATIVKAQERSDAFVQTIQQDWSRQEATAGRTVDSQKALLALGQRASLLLDCLLDDDCITKGQADRLQDEIKFALAGDLNSLTDKERESRYFRLRWAVRDAALENPLVKDIPIVFLKADRYVWQLIHEYLSYYYSHTNMTGGELLILKSPGKSFETESLSQGKFPRGVFSTPSLSFDAKTLYFAFADFSQVVPEGAERTTLQALMDRGRDTEINEYLNRKEGKYHLYKMDLATGVAEQLTDGPDDDFDPVELPDGDLIFVSTRRGGFARCTGVYEPVETATLHKRFQSGEVECLSWHETNEWNPSVLSDGRILYSRWDYVDREAARFMNLWITNPDGTGAQVLFGNYTEKIVASLQAKEIPGSNKILFLGSGHHIAVGGPLAIFDPGKAKYDPATLEDTLDCIEHITPDIPFPETPVPDATDQFHYVSDHYYYSPYPLSENYFLTAYSHDANGGYLARYDYGYRGTCGEPFTAGKLGLYYRDRFGNLELLYQDETVSCRYPIQVKSRPRPPVIASKLPVDKPKDGTFVLSNVYESLVPLPTERTVKELRVFQILPHGPDFPSNSPRLGHARSENARLLLGTVPVEEDGSAHFKVPACKPLYFQAVDEQGRAVRTMLSEVYLQPGEVRGCVGCHEQTQLASKNYPVQGKALTRSASHLTPGPDGSAPMSYPRLVQTILDRRCVSCHDGNENACKPNLTGAPADKRDSAKTSAAENIPLQTYIGDSFFPSYNGLRPYLRWYQWSGETISRIASRPGEAGADMSPLTKILDDTNHGGKIELTEQERRTLYFWMDANVPFYGTGDLKEQAVQYQGGIISIPEQQ
ncbi:MAG: hypothetical protein Q4G68_04865 [Planctomycetia bacterium]|nr:hypothetical protein [Planctomycetia bacterium]